MARDRKNEATDARPGRERPLECERLAVKLRLSSVYGKFGTDYRQSVHDQLDEELAKQPYGKFKTL